MYVNENGKFSSEAEYYYNEYIGMYCVVDTTYCNADFDELASFWESDDLLKEIPMPDYITEDNCEDLMVW